MNTQLQTPILFLLFNRPDLANRVFERIRDVRPLKLFIAVDGPRTDRAGENLLVEECQSFASKVDWPCEVSTLFREENLGCKKAVSGAISWFFDHVESGIILEDDCLPDETFFRYCGELLEFYKDDKTILSIGGHNLGYMGETRYSYGFTRYMNMWGWATWADRAKSIDYKASLWKERSYRNKVRVNISRDFYPILRHDPSWWRYWHDRFSCVWTGEFNTWDYQWVVHGLANDMRSIFPTVNLVSNIGFGVGATHTMDNENPIASVGQNAMEFPMRHQPNKLVNKTYESECVRKNWCGIPFGFWLGLLAPHRKYLRQAKKEIKQRIKAYIKVFSL